MRVVLGKEFRKSGFDGNGQFISSRFDQKKKANRFQLRECLERNHLLIYRQNDS